MMKDYETVIVLNPTLSVKKAEETINKFVDMLAQKKSEIVNVEQWGVREMAYPIKKKSTGFYNLIEFKAEPAVIKPFETELKRDELVMRFLTVALDKYALEYNLRRRNGEFNKKKDKSTKEKATA